MNLGRVVIDEEPLPLLRIHLAEGTICFDIELPTRLQHGAEHGYAVFGPDGQLVYRGHVAIPGPTVVERARAALALQPARGGCDVCGRDHREARWTLHIQLSLVDKLTTNAGDADRYWMSRGH